MAGSGLQPALIALLYAFPALALIVVVVRIWRKKVDRALGGDDALIVIAWILALGNSIITHLYTVEMYVGYYPQDVPFDKIDMIKANKLQYALSVEYNPIMCCIKASFLWSLQRLRSGNIWIRRALWSLQILNASQAVATTIAVSIPCIPVKARWDFSVPGKCYDAYDFVIANVSIVIITDALVLTIPTWMIYDLQMSLRKKLITIAFLSLGFIVIAIGILRLVWLTNAFKGKINNHSVESSYSAIECSVAIIGASGPTVKYIFSRFIPALRPQNESKKASSYGKNGYGYGYGNASGHNASRRTRPNTNAYGDLDSVSVEREEYEMKGDWQWKKDSDTHSDEQRITYPDTGDGITKTVDWTVSSSADSTVGKPPARDPSSENRPAVRPTNVV
ncbi:hypothetical protein CC78DRAFT_587367 [Lojkania enalia]|uniref:Rhodopsin domain-containing protein n=1 Tax=Lojkania enalia TaxID=147567 RepID=A0A9P4JYN8_9PLEO|nr:hypothetical protein CC78DRAFT_587367 [Didymosphaeria enalia]